MHFVLVRYEYSGVGNQLVSLSIRPVIIRRFGDTMYSSVNRGTVNFGY